MNASAPPAIVSVNQPQLVFKTGFEGDTHVIPFRGTDDEMVGHDPMAPNKSDVVSDLGIEHFVLEYTHGDASKRFAKIIPDSGNPKNKVLWFWIGDSWFASNNQYKARVQADIYGLKTGYKNFYQSVRVYLPPDFAALRKYPHPIPWLTISEFWNERYWGGDKYGFRMTLGIGKPSEKESDLNFILDAQGSDVKTIWMAHNEKTKVPIGKWFTMEYYYQEGNAQTGRFYMAITPDGQPKQVVFDATGWTYCPQNPTPHGITDWNPMKLYTSKELVAFMKDQGKALEVYWDDFELWTNRQPTDTVEIKDSVK